MSSPWIIRRTVDLAAEKIPVERLCALATTSSRAAHQLHVTLKDGGKPVGLMGITARLNLILPGERSMTVEGSVEGGELVATLPAQCYPQEGDVKGTLMATQGADIAVPVYAFVLYVRADLTDVLIDPTNTVPSLAALLAQFDAAKAATNRANTAADDASRQARAAEDAARRLSSVGVNVTMLAPTEAASGSVTQTESKTTFALRIPRGKGEKGDKGDPGNGYIRTLTLSLAASSWTGSGPYTATISHGDVTANTWVEIELTAASLANYSAAISWETSAGKITLTTAVKPVGTLAGTLVLMEVV